MWPMLGGLLSGGLNFLGGMLGQQNQSQINAQNVAAQEQINAENIANQQQMLNATLGNQNLINKENLSAAETFAQNGLQWRVQDAKKAGISPLAALGFSSPQAPVAVGANLPAPAQLEAPKVQSSNSFGTGVAAMGQDIGRAISATRSPEEQAVAIEKTRQDLEAGNLDNELKKAQIHSLVTRLASGQIGPGIPKGGPNGIPSDDVVAVTGPGRFTSGPSKTTEGWSWGDMLAKPQITVRDQLLPAFGYNIPKGLPPAHEGSSWFKNPVTGEFYEGHSLPQWWGIVKDLYGHSSSPQTAWPGEGGSTQ